MIEKFKYLIKNTLVFALGNVGSKCILFFLVPLYTNFLSKDDYGTADLIITIGQLLIPIFSLVIFDAVLRFGLENREDPSQVLISGLTVWSFGVIALIVFASLLFLCGIIKKYAVYIVFYVALSSLLQILMNYLKVRDKNLVYSLVSLIQTALLALSNILLIMVFNIGVYGYILSNIISVLIAVILCIVLGNISFEFKKTVLNKSLTVEMAKYSAPLILNNLSWWIIQSSDKMMVEMMVGASALGLYTAACKIPSLINTFTGIFGQSWIISSTIEKDSEERNDFYTKIFETLIGIAFFACICLNSIIKPFMSIYVGKEFTESWKYVPLLVCTAGFAGITAYFGALYGVEKKSVKNTISTLIPAIVNIILNFVLIKEYGVFGAIISTLVSYVLMSIIRTTYITKLIKLRIRYFKLIINSIILIAHSIFVSLDKYLMLSSVIASILFILINIDTFRSFIKISVDLIKRGK